MFLDISKAFDNVWHDGLLFKLKNYGISGFLFTIIKDFLANGQQRVVLNEKVRAGPPLLQVCLKDPSLVPYFS